MKSFRIIVLAVIISAVIGCRQNPASFMAFDDVDYVVSVQNSVGLAHGEVVELDKLGMQDIFICDSLMFVSAPDNEGLVSVYGLPDFEYYDKFFYKGNGPGELLSAPFFGNAKVIESETGKSFLIEDDKGKILSLDVSTPFSCHEHEIEVFRDSLPVDSFYSIYVNDSTVMCRNISADASRQDRYLLVDGRRHVTSSMAVLNKAEIPVKGDGYMFNILSSFSAYDSKHDRVVEASLMLNAINVYSLDGSFERTICLGKSLDNIDDVFHSGMNGLKETFVRLRLYEDFFAVMYSGANMIAENEELPYPKIYFFDWDCHPVVELQLPDHASVFDVDFINGRLYTLDRSEEVIRKYDISNVLEL